MTDISTFSYMPRGKCHQVIDALSEQARAESTKRMIVKALYNAFHTYSPWSAEHSVRVGSHLHHFAEKLGFTVSDAAGIGLSACLHDIGKLAVPRSILNKPGALTDPERELVQVHTREGLNCLDDLKEADISTTKELVMYHHENFDGSGYPYQLAGEDQSPLVRMARIVDFYDAVRFGRPYRKGLSQRATLDLMEQNAALFSPKLLDVFKREIGSIDRISDDQGRTE